MAISADMVKELRERTGLGMMLCKKALEETAGDMEKAIENLRKQGEATLAKRASKEAKEGMVAIAANESATVMLEVNSETDFVARNSDFIAFVNVLAQLLLARQPADMNAALKLSSPELGGRNVEDKLIELTGKIGEKISFRRFLLEKAGPSERVFSYLHGGGRIGVVLKLKATDAAALKTDAVASLGKDCAMQVTASSPLAASRDGIPADVIAKEREIYLTQAQNSGKPEKIWDKIVEGKMTKFYEQVIITEQPFIRDPETKVSDRVKQTETETGTSITVCGFTRYALGS